MSEIDNKKVIAAILYDSAGRHAPRPGADVPATILAALRDAGWVDPEEASRLRAEIQARLNDDDYDPAPIILEYDRMAAERDALLPVVEAARALIDAWDNTSMVDPDDHQMQAGYVSLMSVEDSHALEDAFDRLSQLVGEPVDALDPEPLADVSTVPLADIMAATPDSALGRSAKRVWDQVSGAEERMAGFQSAADDDVISAFQSFVE